MAPTPPPNPLKAEQCSCGLITLSRADGQGQTLHVSTEKYDCFIEQARAGLLDWEQLKRLLEA